MHHLQCHFVPSIIGWHSCRPAQVTSGGLRRLLALPGLVELTVRTFTDDIYPPGQEDDNFGYGHEGDCDDNFCGCVASSS